MKILIVGSLDPEDDIANASEETLATPSAGYRQQFEAACKEIGAALAKDGRTIVIGTASENTADRFVLEGANSVDGKHPVIAIRPDDGRPLPTANQFENLSITSRRRGQSWTVSQAFQITEADVVIALGGGTGTLQAGLMAPALETPTLAVRAFPGAARELWKTDRTDYERADLAVKDIGIFLAFGIMLIYLATGILVIGHVSVDAEGFRNAAVATSLMGFAVAFVAEQAANKLRQQLGERL